MPEEYRPVAIQLNDIGKVIETDVLVLGGGVAGCMAGIGAKEQGAKVLIVEKGLIESSGCGSLSKNCRMSCPVNAITISLPVGMLV